MKVILAAMALTLVAGEASAVPRYQTMRMYCEDVRAVLQDEGAAILRWQSKRNPGLPLYGRYVSDGRYCELGEVSTFASVPTRDDATCPVRKCIRPDHFERRYRILRD